MNNRDRNEKQTSEKKRTKGKGTRARQEFASLSLLLFLLCVRRVSRVEHGIELCIHGSNLLFGLKRERQHQAEANSQR